MIEHSNDKITSGVFVTFSGNCKKALTFYQSCFGGILQFETFEKELGGFTELPIVTGSLVSDKITIHGSDLVHDEGRKLGNYISIFLNCKNTHERKSLIEKLSVVKTKLLMKEYDDQILIEVVDAFDVRWVLAI